MIACDIKAFFNIKYCPLNELSYVKNGAKKIPTTCLIGRTIGRTVVQRNSRQKRSRWSVKMMVENKSPAAKGKFLLLSVLHPHSGGNVMVELQCFRPQYKFKNIREAKI